MSMPDVNEVEPTDDAPASLGGIEIRTLHSASDMREVEDLFRQIWGMVTPVVTLEILMAIAHSGGYVSAAFDTSGDDDRILGASVGLLARHLDQPALHSHITGLLPGAQNAGLGRAMKLHQRQWAHDHGIEWIVWTFDPLVRRNAWFNIAVLGAEIHEYLASFYGTMSDAINAGDESDRLLAAWPVTTDRSHSSPAPEDRSRNVLVPTPDDIIALRRTDPSAASAWRREVRKALTAALDRGDRISGFTSEGEYVVESRS